jgi:hypothetical protein
MEPAKRATAQQHERAVARFAGSIVFFCVRPWGLRPRLYAAVRFADSDLTPTIRGLGRDTHHIQR